MDDDAGRIPRDRFRGCLLGQCLGDALGRPVEGAARDYCDRYVQRYLHPGSDGGWDFGPLEVGQYTDDSQLARELIQSYLDRGGFEPEDYAHRIATIFEENRIVGRGVATERAARRLLEGVSWRESGDPPPSAGNGTAMRAGPAGLFFARDREARAVVAHEQGWITHQDPRCSAGSFVVAEAVALALTDTREPIEWIPDLADSAACFHHGFAEELARLPEWLCLPPASAAPEVACCGLDPESAPGGWDLISPFVIPSVIWSLYCVLRTPDDFMEVVRQAIGAGGDVDTTAAMSGAIVGARVGLAGIPEALVTRVHDNGTWGYSSLLELADRLYAAV